MSGTMTVTFPGGRRVDAAYLGFEIATDQSVEHGGGASAPEPFELFLASLATCAGAYVVGFCRNRDLPTDGVRLVQTWDHDREGKLATVTIRIQVPPEFPEKYHEALVRVANTCAVKRAIEAPPEFVVETVVTNGV